MTRLSSNTQNHIADSLFLLFLFLLLLLHIRHSSEIEPHRIVTICLSQLHMEHSNVWPSCHEQHWSKQAMRLNPAFLVVQRPKIISDQSFGKSDKEHLREVSKRCNTMEKQWHLVRQEHFLLNVHRRRNNLPIVIQLFLSKHFCHVSLLPTKMLKELMHPLVVWFRVLFVVEGHWEMYQLEIVLRD